MGLGGFFKKIGSGISNIANKAWQGTKYVGGKVLDGAKYIGKAAKPVINIAQKVTGLTDKIPGMIGEASKLVSGGLDKVKGWIDMIPEGGIKNKLKEYSDDAVKIIDKGREKLEFGGKVLQGGADKINPWIGFAGKVADNLSGAKPLTGRMTEEEMAPYRQGMNKQAEYNRRYGMM